MKKVYLCAPLGGDVAGNIERAKEYAHYVLKCGAAPVVPHFYALILDDNDPQQRQLGLRAGQALLWGCDEIWVFGGHVTPGMKDEISLATALRIKTQYFKYRKKLFGGTQLYETKKGY